ncbi:CpaB family Flp pilus assembly protein [Caballeronia udeis]|uniref:CpaB family Flp pilus assembly protein n=1 Tax=Caballeronia udeis TaxID=1232866 RepID=A0A158H0J8_9BURK|nr:Flp pilus assembly protein CpaB [Caballeronia udeis]SAL37895.1 CpaB family Flp pilus assembly protein [Caballeronia udeis]
MANITRILAVSLIVLAVLLGIFAWTLSRRPVAPVPQIVQGQASFPVVVAKRDLPPGKPIDADALTLRMAPSRGAGEFADATGLVGRVPLIAITANTPLSEANLTTGLADAIAPGERAIAVRVDEGNAVGNRVRPGNFVDVFFMLKRDMSAGPGADAEVDATQARLLLSKVRVLSFGDATLPGTSDAGDANANAANAPRGAGARTAVLAVRTADIDALTLAEGAGRLVLALRNPADTDIAEPPAMAPLLASIRMPNNDASRAATGLSLEALAGSRGERSARTPVMPPLPAMPSMLAARAPRVQAVSNDLELIRGAHREKVTY